MAEELLEKDDHKLNPMTIGPGEADLDITFYRGTNSDPTVIRDEPMYTVVEGGVTKTVHTESKDLRDYIDKRTQQWR